MKRLAGSSVVDRGSNRKVSKNHIGGVKVSRIALSGVDRGSNRRVSKNHTTKHYTEK